MSTHGPHRGHRFHKDQVDFTPFESFRGEGLVFIGGLILALFIQALACLGEFFQQNLLSYRQSSFVFDKLEMKTKGVNDLIDGEKFRVSLIGRKGLIKVLSVKVCGMGQLPNPSTSLGNFTKHIQDNTGVLVFIT